MSTPPVAHLHVHSEYSLLDGACNIDKLAERAAAYGQPAIGLTDHGVMNGAVELFKAAQKHGIKPLLGLEAYFVDDRKERDRKIERNHLTLLAASNEGFKNLTTLSSKGFLEGLYRGKPGVDLELLSEHAEGVICLTGCLASRTSQRIIEAKEGDARAHLDELIQVFGPEDVYLEVQRNGLTEQEQVNEAMRKFAAETGRPMVGTADVHYLRKEDFHHHAALLCVQTKSTLAAPKMSFTTNEFYLKSSEEMAESFAEFPGALESTVEIADRCEVDIALGGQLIPRFDCPDGLTEKEYLRSLVEAGLRHRYGDPPPVEAVERMEMELGVIDSMGFNAYFLIVWDFVAYAKSNGIAVGPGRGSAAGSIVSYALQITDVDPLAYDLLFERFLNAERVSMPDIDIDFSVRGRERVIRYVTEKYGADRVAQIITFGKMFPRAATRDAARVLGHDYGVGDKLAKLIPDPIMGRPPSFDECLAPGADLAAEVARDPIAKQIVDVAQGLEGIVRNASIHAAAVVISDRALTDIVPLQLADAGTGEDGAKVYRTVTQFSMKPIEEIGLLKMDFLGLRNLDVIEDALDIIERSSGRRPDMANLELADGKTYEMMARGDSIGVFQFESEGMREALRKVNPTEFEDLVALVALYRPGAMDQIPAYARGKRSPETIAYIDDRLRSITESTKGVILYQEQAMQIAKSLAGFSGPKADDLRKAIGKKNRAAMAKLQPEFIEGCRASGTAPDVIETLWATNEKSADYSFNKCASGDTRVILTDGTRIRLSEAYRLQPAEIMSMWSDGVVRPHRVERIVKTGRKPIVHVRCASGRQIKATLDHRLLTTEGYLEIRDMKLGTELITTPMISEQQREARRRTMTKLAKSPARMRRMHALHPDLTRAGVAAMHERVRWLWANDPEWRAKQMERSFNSVRAAYDTGPGYGHCSIASNGMWCASWPEREMCEWLIDQGIEFEMHKAIANGRMCDFYFDGVYWEMDGMDRPAEYFAKKYGDLPHVVVTPEDFRFRVERHMATAHAENGDPIVSIEPAGVHMTYDVEMSADGPLNFLANGIVSHNSHAACYALISYRTAWLKANHPAEYMAALISSVMDTKDKVPFFVNQAEAMGIEILPPDVNLSDHEFMVVEGNIRFGLDAVKGVGYAAVEAIKKGREEGGDFTSLWDFCERVDARTVNKRSIEALIKCGAFGSTGATRRGMLDVLDSAQAAGQRAQQDAQMGQGSIFDLFDAGAGGDGAPTVAAPSYPPLPTHEYERTELLAMEKESIGIFISEHPLKRVREALKVKADCSTAQVMDQRDGDWVKVGGMITESKKIRTRTGSTMMFATLDDLDGSVEIVVFEKALAAAESVIANDAIVLVRGRVDHKEAGKVCIIVQDVDSFDPSDAEIERAKAQVAKQAAMVPQAIKRRVEAAQLPASVIDDLRELFERYQGDCEFVLEMHTRTGLRRLKFGEAYKVKARDAGFKAELDVLLGAASPVAA